MRLRRFVSWRRRVRGFSALGITQPTEGLSASGRDVQLDVTTDTEVLTQPFAQL
jgi:hypothetical protein